MGSKFRAQYVKAPGAPQVLNMKPAEILGMLEEAAGTRMYENKKDGALRTLDKKQLKVDEIEKARALSRRERSAPWTLERQGSIIANPQKA